MISTAREAVAAALAGLGIPVHAYPPEALRPPAAVIIPGEPYLSGFTLGRGTALVRLQVQLVTVKGAVQSMDTLLWAAQLALTDAGLPPEPIPPPRHDITLGQLVARIPLSLHWKD